MKKKLSLHRETLAHLNPDTLSAAGAATNESTACSFTICQGCVTKYRAECQPRLTVDNSCAC
ncbi:MAG TPA: class I lanthipeptide [Thermoanaerobaculia bacterium]|nr:class I lanthipeptide [Thermoanaerobaculia bacterium]